MTLRINFYLSTKLKYKIEKRKKEKKIDYKQNNQTVIKKTGVQQILYKQYCIVYCIYKQYTTETNIQYIININSQCKISTVHGPEVNHYSC